MRFEGLTIPMTEQGRRRNAVVQGRANLPLAQLLKRHELQQAALVVAAFFVYFAVRGITQGSRALAVDHARAIVNLEKRLGFCWEPWLQDQMIHHPWLVTFANWIYIWGHWPVIAAVAIWLVIRHPVTFRLFRNSFFISGAIGIVIFILYPVAPPRLLELGLADTITQHSHSYRVLQPPAFVNQYAAVPSLHLGWDLLIAIAVVREARHWFVRLVAIAVPVLMLWAIVVTGNHFIFDAIAGAAVAMVGLAVAANLAHMHAPRRRMSVRPRQLSARV